ncbi:G protein [Kolente virus]|uniref:G protein n=1 Tax=Kolente virus TaxID=1428456 RepID=V5PZR3_9RHAB|nr:G protein [Kolente virus]AHB08864.1 G protein [Kolente virus]
MILLIILSLLARRAAGTSGGPTPAPLQDPSIVEKSDHLDGTILLPLRLSESWKPISVSSLECPHRAKRTGRFGVRHKVFNLTRFDHFSSGLVEGYLCHKIRWVTSCQKTWYFSATVTRRVEPLLPTEAECREAVNLEQHGILESGSYPPESCYWNSLNEEAVTEIHLTTHNVGLNPYTMEWVDSIFLKGSCKDQICPTEHSTVLWLKDPDQQTHNMCGTEVTEHAELMKRASSGSNISWSDYTLVSHHLPATTMEGACYLDFCGKEGIHLHNGIWFALPDISKLGPETLSRCPEDTKAGSVSPAYAEDDLQFQLKDMKRDIECLNVLETIQATGTISFRSLQYFHPRDVGVHPVYRIINGSLEMATARYAIAHIPLEGNESCIGLVTENTRLKCVGWNDWIPVKENLKQGFNGIMSDHGRIIYPIRYLLGDEWNPEMHALQYVKFMPHPLLHPYSHQIKDKGRSELVMDHSQNVGDVIVNSAGTFFSRIGSFFSQAFDQLIHIAVILGIGLACYVAVKMFLKWKRNREPFKAVERGQKEQEMTELAGFG